MNTRKAEGNILVLNINSACVVNKVEFHTSRFDLPWQMAWMIRAKLACHFLRGVGWILSKSSTLLR
jgi:hypothetical protein